METTLDCTYICTEIGTRMVLRKFKKTRHAQTAPSVEKSQQNNVFPSRSSFICHGVTPRDAFRSVYSVRAGFFNKPSAAIFYEKCKVDFPGFTARREHCTNTNRFLPFSSLFSLSLLSSPCCDTRACTRGHRLPVEMQNDAGDFSNRT